MSDIIYELLRESKENFYKEKNKGYIINKIRHFNNFYQLNVMFDTEKIGKEIGVTNLGHLMILLKTIDLKTNEVNYSILNLSEDRLKKVKTLFKQFNLVKKVKLTSEKESKYYFNPDIIFYGKGSNIELIEYFRIKP